MRAYLVAWRQWKEGEVELPPRNFSYSQGGGAMGEAMRPAKEHVLLRRLPRFSAEQVRREAEDQSSALIAERLDRVLVRRLVGGIQPEDEADGGGEPDREQHNAQRH